MSAMNHTPEPWRTECWASHAPCSVVADLDPAEPTEIDGQNVLWLGRIHIAECEGSRREGGNEANAARIVACVNACAGLVDPLVEITKLVQAEMERVELLAALRDLLPYAEACVGPRHRVNPPQGSVIVAAKRLLSRASA